MVSRVDVKLGCLSAKIITEGQLYGSLLMLTKHPLTLYHKLMDVQYSLIHKTNVFTIYISTYLHIYPHILYLSIVVLANFNLLSRPFIMLPPGRQLASGRGAVAAMQCIMQI